MGAFRLFSRSSNDYGYVPEPPRRGNPNPLNFYIMSLLQIGNNVVAQIKYPDADNYEGIKVLLFTNVKVDQIQKLTSIDPHFTDNKSCIAPFARFEPTANGLNAAKFLARQIK